MTRVVGVTGGLGFIGSYVVEQLLQRGDYVWLVDSETYAANTSLLDLPTWRRALDAGTLRYVKADIVELARLPDLDAIINLAAETHVDNSIADASHFVRTNIGGVYRLLELLRGKRAYQIPLLVHISTDEVYGSVQHGETVESASLAPSSPYAASKASADLMIAAFGQTFGLPWCIVRPSNCYGVRQYPEKLIPKAVRHLALGRTIPIHEGGNAVRCWLHVEDCARAILTVLDRGVNHEVYNVDGEESSVREVVGHVVRAFHGESANPPDYMDFGFVRLGLDARYNVNATKLHALGWSRQHKLQSQLASVVEAERATLRW